MQEQDFWKIAAATGGFGIILLLAVEQGFQPETTKIGEITEHSSGKTVKIKGIVEWKREKNNAVVFGLNDGNTIKCVLFGSNNPAAIPARKIVIVEGKVQAEKNENIIIVKRIEEWKQ